MGSFLLLQPQRTIDDRSLLPVVFPFATIYDVDTAVSRELWQTGEYVVGVSSSTRDGGGIGRQSGGGGSEELNLAGTLRRLLDVL